MSKVLRRPDESSTGNPSGLAINGNDMWAILSGPSAPILFHYSLSDAFSGSGNITSDWQIDAHLDNDRPIGLAIDEDYLYVVDETDKQIYRYSYDNDLQYGEAAGRSGELLDMYDAAIGLPSGAMFDDEMNWIWVVDRGTDTIYGYPRDGLFNDDNPVSASDQFPLVSENDDPTGL